jgi:hypothetical protein
MTTTYRAFALLAPLALALAACGGSTDTNGGPDSNGIPESTGTAPEQLEATSVIRAGDPSPMTLDGKLAVSGAERDFAIQVPDATGASFELQIHTPGMADLGTLAGHYATVEVSDPQVWDETVRGVVISDDSGPLYVANPGFGVDETALFGKPIVTWGETVATEISPLSFGSSNGEDYEEKSYTKVVFMGDEGNVAVGAGEVASVVIGGAIYRVNVVSAFEVQYHTSEEYGCGEESTLIYEMLRVQAAPEPKKLVRPANLDPAGFGCMGV